MPNTIQKPLLTWYTKNRRDLPWRKTHDPYRIWVSEMMLQQTQVSTVIPYYHRFLKAFPTLKHLARAREERVLKLWEGLGYYARARNLRKACQEIVKKYGGRVPQDADALRQLPGIGPYTVGAILSIAFDKPFPLVDGNVSRVLCRVHGIRKDPSSPQVRRKLWELARSLVPFAQPGDFNQGLMELGATICTPSTPQCPSCPIAHLCTAHKLNLEHVIPIPVRRTKVKKQYAAIALVQKNGYVLVRKRPSEGLLGGLWEFPQMTIHKKSPLKNLETHYKKELNLELKVVRCAFTLRHRFTHIDLRMACYECRLADGFKHGGLPTGFKWIRLHAPKRVPLSRAHQKIAASLSPK